ncbi:hypothetical protein SBRY_10817 [Actinacidiphila bryophytorum]|uniref:Uncharacterized protein n=1 Tax=Actinacidiphila bryophytorum TaxID=1436133 RepID=A0A9W4GXT6_9ACTN|nr:hypothetical protein SBRY_10817 [Actinacidiphila bryophytorum]
MKETLPPRARLRWLLMTMRLSNSSFTGMARTEVAVGSSSDAFMFLATAAAGPRRVTNSVSLSAAGAAGACAGLAAGCAAAGCAAAGAGAAGGQARSRCRGAGGAGMVWRAGRGGHRLAGRHRCGGRACRGPRRPALARGGRRGGRAVRLVVGEEVPPGSVYRVRILEVLLVDLIDQPLVRAETRGRAFALRLVVGRDTRAIGGLWRHGGNRPLPLHKMVDSGNKGYAYRSLHRRLGVQSSRKSHLKQGFRAVPGGKTVPLEGCPARSRRLTLRALPAPGVKARREQHPEG